MIQQKQDSVLTSCSSFSRRLSNAVIAKDQLASFKHEKLGRSIKTGSINPNSAKRVERIAKEKGFIVVQSKAMGRSVLDFYFGSWFAGRYIVSESQSLSEKLKKEAAVLPPPLNLDGIEPHPTLLSQFQAFQFQKDQEKEIAGELTIASSNSTGQEPNSGLDNNYYQFRGSTIVPVGTLPVEVEGYYTTQDARRTIKSSHFKVHYDVGKLKEELQQQIGSFNRRFSESQSQSVGMDGIYRNAINKMQQQRKLLTAELEKETQQQIAEQVKDTAAFTGKAKDTLQVEKAKKRKAQLEEKRKKFEDLEKKINNYETLLSQYRSKNYFDSAAGFANTRKLALRDELSYKQLAKRSVSILPDGKAKKLISGLTSFDAGIFSKYSSRYTASGQVMKGIDLAYDLDVCEVGVSAGKTEYVGRDGGLDKYTFYSARSIFRLLKGQKAGLIYYGYTPDKKAITTDVFFSKLDISTPTFREPVHVLSATLDGQVMQSISYSGEVAGSFRQMSVKEVNGTVSSFQDRLAYHFSADGKIPHTPINLEGSYDHTGKQFENNTLPIGYTGTTQYRLSGRSDFLGGKIGAGINWNYIVQSNYNGESGNTKWGFDLKTQFRMYPNVSLAYKPFSTFRSFSDTLGIPQRPMAGSIWTAKASWKLKRHARNWNILLLYNSCSSEMDTAAYGNTLTQATAMYQYRDINALASVGYMAQTSYPAQNFTTPSSMIFGNIGGGYSLNKALSISGAQEAGWAPFGFCRYSCTGGINASFKKRHIVLRLNLRGTAYRLTNLEPWKAVFSSNAEVVYRFHKSVPQRH